MRRFAVLAAAVAALSSPAAHAALGDYLIVAKTGEVILTFQGSDAGYDSKLSVNGSPFVFPNHSTPVGATYDLGYFAAGTVLDAALYVINTGYTFHSGPGSLNPDGDAHALVYENYLGTGDTYVGFEDIYGTPDGAGDYNDHTFSFSNTAVTPTPPPPISSIPEPSTDALMLAGMAGLAFAGWRRRRQG